MKTFLTWVAVVIAVAVVIGILVGAAAGGRASATYWGSSEPVAASWHETDGWSWGD